MLDARRTAAVSDQKGLATTPADAFNLSTRYVLGQPESLESRFARQEPLCLVAIDHRGTADDTSLVFGRVGQGDRLG